METATAEAPIASLRAAFDGAPCGAVPELGRGWVVLRNCALGGGGRRVGLALLHPDVGVALVDFSPEATDAADRFRRALDARRFPAIFGGYPPVVRAVLPADRPADLGDVLAAAFKAQPPLALAGGDAWVRTARAAIEAESPVAVPGLLRAKRRRGFPWGAAVLGTVGVAGVGVALATLLVLPGHGVRDAAAPAAGLSAAAVPGAAARPQPATAPETGAPVAPETAAALSGLAETLSAALPPESRAAPAGEDATDLDVLEALLSAEPAAGTEASTGAGAEVAAFPRTSGGPPTDTAIVGEERPPSPAQPPTAAVGPGTANTATESPPLKRATAAPADPPPQPASRVPAAVNRRTASPAPSGQAPEAAGGGRCRDILRRATMGEALAEADWGHLRRGCQPRG